MLAARARDKEEASSDPARCSMETLLVIRIPAYLGNSKPSMARPCVIRIDGFVRARPFRLVPTLGSRDEARVFSPSENIRALDYERWRIDCS